MPSKRGYAKRRNNSLVGVVQKETLLVVKEVPAFVSGTDMEVYGGFKVGEKITEGQIPKREFELIKKLGLGRVS